MSESLAVLGRVQGRVYDRAARNLRNGFLNGAVDPASFIDGHMVGLPRTREARFQNKVDSYATASLVIEPMWEFLRASPIAEKMRQAKREIHFSSTSARILLFAAVLAKLHDAERNRFLDEASLRIKNKAPYSTDDLRFLAFLSVATKRHRHLKGIPLPSMSDLFVLFARYAEVALRVYSNASSTRRTLEGYLALLRHPYLLKFFVGVMSNDRKTSMPLFARLSLHTEADLNTFSIVFDPDCFELVEEGGVQSVRVKQTIMAEHCAHYAKAAKRREKRGKSHPRVVGCPALYGGEFREMYEWVLKLFEEWMAPLTPTTAP